MMSRSLILVRNAARNSQQHATSLSLATPVISQKGQEAVSVLASSRLTSPRRISFSTAPLDHDRDNGGEGEVLPPKIKNTFGSNFDWKDPLRIKSLLTEEEVCSCPGCFQFSAIFAGIALYFSFPFFTVKIHTNNNIIIIIR